MRISVLIPTYKRKDYLIKCLSALERQTRIPDEVIIVVRNTDTETKNVLQYLILKSDLKIKVIFVSSPGVITAENAGLQEVTGDIICFTDDDVEVFEDWLQKIEPYYLDKQVGGVGGSIIYPLDKSWIPQKVKKVGKVSYYGRIIGNHYQKVNKIQDIDFFTGTNMSFRRSVICQVDPNLKGDGFNFEVDLGLEAKGKGYKLIFDPEIQVKHFGAPRSEWKREDLLRFYYNGYNTTYIILKHFSFMRKLLFLLYCFGVGDIASPGLIRTLFLVLKGQPFKVVSIFFNAFRGKIKGLLRYQKVQYEKNL